MSHVISILALLAGITAMRGKPCISLFLRGEIPTPTMSAPIQPLENFQRPRTTTPSSVISAGCGGKIPPANTTSGPFWYNSFSVSSGKLPKYAGLIPKLATQPTEPSALDKVSINSQNCRGDHSSPPKRLGTKAR